MKDLYHAFLKKIAHFQVDHPFLTVALILMATLAIYGGVSQVKTVASLEQMMPKDVEEIKAFNVLRDNYLGQDMIGIIISVDRESRGSVLDIRDQSIYYYVKKLSETLKQESDILEVYSFTDLIPEMESNAYTTYLDDPLLKEKLKNYVNDDSTITIIIATTDVSANDPRMNLLSTAIKKDVEGSGRPPGVKIQFTGTPIIQQRLGELISHDRTSTQWISTGLVFLITFLIFQTITSALMPIIIVTISVLWLYGTMGYGGLPISTLAGGVAAMVIGIGIDFAIHIINKFKFERKKGLSIKEAIEQAVVDTGTTLTATSLTTIVAFLAFLIGAMPEMGRFGILMAIGITYSLVFTIFGLPALLIIEETTIYKIKNKLKFGVEGEFKLTTNKRNTP